MSAEVVEAPAAVAAAGRSAEVAVLEQKVAVMVAEEVAHLSALQLWRPMLPRVMHPLER